MWPIILVTALIACMFAIFLLVDHPKDDDTPFGEDIEEMRKDLLACNDQPDTSEEIGRASCRERVSVLV